MTTQLSDILFKDYRRRLLGLLLLHPEQAYHVREIARLTGTVAGTANKELRKLSEAGVLVKQKQGNQLLYQADKQCVVYEELASLLRKTSGLADVLANGLLPLADSIDAAFVFGSMASGKTDSGSDIDLCVVGSVTFAELVKAVYSVQQTLGREINPKCFSVAEWQHAVAENSVFIQELLHKPTINIIGNKDALIKQGM